MVSSETGTAALIEKLREFDRVATALDMPHSERLNILNISEETYASLRNGAATPGLDTKPELERRLSYALPLMRRLSRNTPDRSAGKRANKPFHKV